jgi:hypothetical protein
MVRNFFITLLVLFVGVLFFGTMVLFGVPALQESTFVLAGLSSKSDDSGEIGTEKANIENDIKKLKKKLDSYSPTDAYLVVNTSDNHFFLYKGKKLIREGNCSTGKNEKLVSAEGENTFYTPKGVRKVLRKQPDPVWKKPDWAFREEGLPIPSANHPSRYETGTLGKYKLELGNGYMIHGTIYKRFIGQSVTHGCIRLLDEDLEAVYKTMAVGSKVYIY